MENDIPDELWDNLPTVEKPVQRRVWINADNNKFLNEMDKAGCSPVAVINLALDLLRPKLNNHNLTFENIVNHVNRLPK
jgi:hypothetical protein